MAQYRVSVSQEGATRSGGVVGYVVPDSIKPRPQDEQGNPIGKPSELKVGETITAELDDDAVTRLKNEFGWRLTFEKV